MLNFIDFKKAIKKSELAVYPDSLSNVGFYFAAHTDFDVELVRVRVAFFDGCICLHSDIFAGTLMTYDKAWEIYTKSLLQIC